jgi:MFS transporter, FSR family, fosmidomycin resistance protein
VGLLIAVPLLLGSLLELPLGLVAGSGRRRHWLVLAGGVLVTASLAAVSAAQSLLVLLVALVAFFPASGAFVSLTQAALMDASPGRQQSRMAAWNLAGSAGAVGGPLILAGVLAAGGTWRSAYLALAGAAAAALCGAAVAGPARAAPSASDQDPATDAEQPGGDRRPAVREALAAMRDGEVARWLVLLQVGDLLLDVLTGYVGIYLVDAAGASPAQAAIGVAIRLGGGLAGDGLFVLLAARVSGRTAVRVSATAACLLYPAFLLVPSLPGKLIILAVLSATTSCWYPAMQAGLYSSLPDRSGIAVFLSSAAGFAGALGPLAVGLIAQQAGLTWALAGLAGAPVAVLALLPGRTARRSRKVMR